MWTYINSIAFVSSNNETNSLYMYVYQNIFDSGTQTKTSLTFLFTRKNTIKVSDYCCMKFLISPIIRNGILSLLQYRRLIKYIKYEWANVNKGSIINYLEKFRIVLGIRLVSVCRQYELDQVSFFIGIK